MSFLCDICFKRFVLRSCVSQVWSQANPTSARQEIIRLETQGRADAAVLRLRASGGKIPSSGVSVSSLKSFSDWMRPAHIKKDNLHYSKSTGLNVNLI